MNGLLVPIIFYLTFRTESHWCLCQDFSEGCHKWKLNYWTLSFYLSTCYRKLDVDTKLSWRTHMDFTNTFLYFWFPIWNLNFWFNAHDLLPALCLRITPGDEVWWGDGGVKWSVTARIKTWSGMSMTNASPTLVSLWS